MFSGRLLPALQQAEIREFSRSRRSRNITCSFGRTLPPHEAAGADGSFHLALFVGRPESSSAQYYQSRHRGFEEDGRFDRGRGDDGTRLPIGQIAFAATFGQDDSLRGGDALFGSRFGGRGGSGLSGSLRFTRQLFSAEASGGGEARVGGGTSSASDFIMVI